MTSITEPKIKINPGLYCVNKPVGWTSFDVVNKLKKLSREKKIGHAGTLDPMATGVLVIGVGKSFTRRLQQITGTAKEYIAEISLGIKTDTYDLEGKIVNLKRPEKEIEKEVLEKTLSNFQGEIQQKPPIYSAVKKNGRRLYEYARKNIEIEIEARTVTVYSIDLLEYSSVNFPKVVIQANVSKGTYIRTLAYDIGELLGTGAVLSGLIRTAVGDFQLKDAYEVGQFY